MTWTPAAADTALAAIALAIQPRHPDLPPPASPLPDTALTPAQLSAIAHARNALIRFGGCLIADPPGSGKSFIGLQLALEAEHRGDSVLITAPAALHTTWKHLLDTAHVHARFLSHTRLSLDDHTVAQTPAPTFILVDEAHAFRSPSTRRYHTLARLARSARLLLTTATPINNSLMDLYFQLHLFLADHALAHAGIADLRAAFRAAACTPGPLPPPLRSALRLVVIRRPRTSAPSAPSVLPPSFPALAPPRLVHYDLDALRPGFTRTTLRTLEQLSLAAFAATARAPAELLRLTLAKRLESGLAAFADSLRSILAFHEAFLDALAAGRLIRPRDLGDSLDDAVQLAFAAVVGDAVPRSLDRSRIERRARSDAAAIRRLLVDCRHLLPRDPKRLALLRLLDGPLRNRHVLLFTEFRATAADLWALLRARPGIGRLDGQGAWLASGRCGRADLIRRFAPAASHAPPPPPHQRIHTLIATDILSEGINLQDADTVISYDLPWNPVRLLQRIGRIDRLGSPHASIRADIFMPDRWLDEFMALLDRVDRKLAAIRHGLGSARPDATAAMDRHVAFVRALADGAAPAAVPFRPDPADPDADRHPLAELLRHPRVIAAEPPRGTAIPVAPFHRAAAIPGILLALDAPDGVRFVAVAAEGAATPLAASAVCDLLRSALQSPDAPLPGALPQKVVAALERAAASARDLAPALPADGSTVPRAIRRVVRLAATASTPDLAPLADRLVSRISAGLRAGDLIALRRWCRVPLDPADPAAAARLLRLLDEGIGPPADPALDASSIRAAFVPSHDLE